MFDLIRNREYTSLTAKLKAPQIKGILNRINEKGCSALYLALSLGYGRDQPEILHMLMNQGAVIKNGVTGQPRKVPKLLTRHSNAKNIQYIFHKLCIFRDGLKPGDLLLEIGSGDGYLKYLLDICRDEEMSRVAKKIIETEPSAKLVQDSSSQGRYMLQCGVEELKHFFHNDSLTAIISFNVLDLFPVKELSKKLLSLSRFLIPGGYIIHIMSSSVHKAVFQNIREIYPGYIMLPYYKEGYVGVRLVNPEKVQPGSDSVEPEQLADLFARKPEKYIQAADEISRNFTGFNDQGIILVLKDYSLQQILAGLQQTGFNALACEEITSTSLAEPDEYHGVFPGYNQFTSIAGSLLTDRNEQIASHQVLEKSVFFFIIAEKVCKR